MRRFAAFLTLVVAIANFASNEAQARGRGRSSGANAAAQKAAMIKAALAQVAAGKQVLAAAESQASDAESRLSEANNILQGARGALDTARSDARKSSEQLSSIEDGIITGAGSESEIYLARENLQSAKEKLNTALKDALGSDAYQAKVAAAESSPEKVKVLSELRKTTLEDDKAYQDALENLAKAKAKFSRLHAEIVETNSEYKAAAAALHEAHQESSKADHEAHRGGGQKLPAVRNLKAANNVAANARAAIAEGEAMLKQLGYKPPAPPKTVASKAKK
jgi:DNA repair exonuclease SbcCD ATPase subunit